MHRRRRIRKALMPTMRDMEVDGSGADGLDHSKPLTESKRVHEPTNIQSLTSQLEKITIKKMAADQKKAKKPKYISTEALLRFKR